MNRQQSKHINTIKHDINLMMSITSMCSKVEVESAQKCDSRYKKWQRASLRLLTRTRARARRLVAATCRPTDRTVHTLPLFCSPPPLLLLPPSLLLQRGPTRHAQRRAHQNSAPLVSPYLRRKNCQQSVAHETTTTTLDARRAVDATTRLLRRASRRNNKTIFVAQLDTTIGALMRSSYN